jgi:hypothetical protein
MPEPIGLTGTIEKAGGCQRELVGMDATFIECDEIAIYRIVPRVRRQPCRDRFDIVRFEQVVGVAQHDVVAAGGGHPRIASFLHAAICQCKYAYFPGILGQNLGRMVRRAVIDHNDFQERHMLVACALDGGADQRGAIIGRNDEAERRDSAGHGISVGKKRNKK